jgi:CHAT domain-containing protein
MLDSYRKRFDAGRTGAAALREAKLALLRAGGATSHPYHWAGFVLWGLP